MELHNQTPPARGIVAVIVRDVLSRLASADRSDGPSSEFRKAITSRRRVSTQAARPLPRIASAPRRRGSAFGWTLVSRSDSWSRGSARLNEAAASHAGPRPLGRDYEGTQIESSGWRESPKARRRSGVRLATQAAMYASSRSCRLPRTVALSRASRSCGFHPVRSATAVS